MNEDDPTITAAWMLLVGFGVSVVMQCSFFAIAYLCQFDKVTDLAGTLNFFVLAILSFCLQGLYTTRSIVVTSLVTVWAVRLGGYLLARVLSRGKDDRFDEIRAQCLLFFGFWVFQIVWVFVVSIPVMLINSAEMADGVQGFGTTTDIIGVSLWVVGFLIETAADYSKDAFYKDKAKRGTLLRTNVWKYSRHPNYFGEILCWLGIFVLSLAVVETQGIEDNDRSWFYVGVLSPVVTFVILMFGSGVPPAEDRYDKRFGTDPEYLDYKKSTSVLVPCPPALYRSLPQVVKQTVFLDLPMYSRTLRELQMEHRTTTSYNSMA